MSEQKKYTVGTLEYSLRQLINVFFWMLWGAIGMSLIAMTFGSGTKFIFRANGLSDTVIAVVLGMIISWMNTVMNPIISTASDNCRARLGRRIPYMLYTAVPTAFFIAALPFYGYLLPYLPETIGPLSAKELVFGAGVVLYYFFFLCVGIVYYYLIPDVIPAGMMGRYYGFFRVVGAVLGVGFSKFVYPYIASHPKIIYPAVGAAYLVITLLVCYFVREGKYPPLEKKSDGEPWFKRVSVTIKDYVKDCYGSSYYWWFYVAGLAFGLSPCVNIFMDFFYLDSCGMTMSQMGELGALISIVTVFACLGAGFVVDYLGAFVAAIIALTLMAVFNICGGIFIHDYISSIIWRIPLAVFSSIYAVAGGRMLVEVFPRSKFGMIASGQNILVSLFAGLVNYPLGLFSDFLRNATPETTLIFMGHDFMPMLRGYRFVNYWAGLCIAIAMVILLYFYVFYQKKRTTKACDE